MSTDAKMKENRKKNNVQNLWFSTIYFFNESIKMTGINL